MSLLAELQRRSVFKVAAAYLVVGWLLIQVAATVAPQLDLPSWAPRLITLLVALGFPVALLLAWAFELTPEGVKVDAGGAGSKRIFIIAAAFAALALAWYLRAPEARDGSAVTSGSTADARSIAVLPFVNMSGDAENEYFSDGISEEILNVLARVPELSVAARTSSFQFKGERRDVAQIAAQLKVRMVLEGSVRKQGERVRITAQLIDADKGFHVWSQTYDRDLKDIFAIQDEIARAIGDELKVRVLGEGEAGRSVSGTRDLEAHDLYLRGLSLWQGRTSESLMAAKDAFERAIAKDPEFVEGWAGLAMTYRVMPDYTANIELRQAHTLAVDAAARTLALDPLNAEAFATLGSMRYDMTPETAYTLLQRAIALKPSFATAHQWLGGAYLAQGRVVDAIASFERGVALDPRSMVIASNLAAANLVAERYDSAIAACRATFDWAPDWRWCRMYSGHAYLMLDRIDDARAQYEAVARAHGRGAADVAAVFEALAGRGDLDAIARRLAATPALGWQDPNGQWIFNELDVPTLLVRLGRPELAIQYIEAARQSGLMQWSLQLPGLDPIRCDRRFIAVVARQRAVDGRAAARCGADART